MRKSQLAKPNRKNLKLMYKGLLTASISQRIQVLSQALQWYDSAIEYVIDAGKVSPTRHRALTSAIQARDRGISAHKHEDREEAFKQSIMMYEKVCERLRPTGVGRQYRMLARKRKRLEHKAHRISARFDWVLQMLTKSLGWSKLRIKVIDNAQKPRSFNGADEFMYSRAQADNIRKTIRKEGLLVALVEELPLLTRAMATTVHLGKMVHDPYAQILAYDHVLRNFVAFCKSGDAPKRLVKEHFDEDAPEKLVRRKKGRTK